MQTVATERTEKAFICEKEAQLDKSVDRFSNEAFIVQCGTSSFAMAKVPLDVVWLEWQSGGGGGGAANSAWTDAYLCRKLIHSRFIPSSLVHSIAFCHLR